MTFLKRKHKWSLAHEKVLSIIGYQENVIKTTIKITIIAWLYADENDSTEWEVFMMEEWGQLLQQCPWVDERS